MDKLIISSSVMIRLSSSATSPLSSLEPLAAADKCPKSFTLGNSNQEEGGTNLRNWGGGWAVSTEMISTNAPVCIKDLKELCSVLALNCYIICDICWVGCFSNPRVWTTGQFYLYIKRKKRGNFFYHQQMDEQHKSLFSFSFHLSENT